MCYWDRTVFELGTPSFINALEGADSVCCSLLSSLEFPVIV